MLGEWDFMHQLRCAVVIVRSALGGVIVSSLRRLSGKRHSAVMWAWKGRSIVSGKPEGTTGVTVAWGDGYGHANAVLRERHRRVPFSRPKVLKQA